THSIVEHIDATARGGVRQPVRVDSQRDRCIPVPELLAHVRDRLTRAEQQRREGMSHLMWSAPMELRHVENLVERLADVGLVELRPDARAEHPLRTQAVLEELHALTTEMEAQHGSELAGHIDPAPLVILRRRQFAADEVPLDLHVTALPINIAPLERQ